MALGTERDVATHARDTDVSQAFAQHRRPRHRSRPARSPSLSHSSTTTNGSSPRSPSPIISFHPAPLSPENTKGVKNITRKVIKRLEGLGHLEMVDVDLAVSEEEDEPEEWGSNRVVEGSEEREVEKVLYALGREAVKHAKSKKTSGMIAKPDLEIPRKVFHSSIGPFSFSVFLQISN